VDEDQDQDAMSTTVESDNLNVSGAILKSVVLHPLYIYIPSFAPPKKIKPKNKEIPPPPPQ